LAAASIECRTPSWDEVANELIASSAPSTVMLHGRIHTLDPEQPIVQALAIQRGTVIAVGRDAEIEPMAGRSAEVVDLEERCVFPGLIDAHIHLEQYAQSLDQLDCEVPDLQICLERVRERAEQTPPGEWILGHGWNQNDWGRFGTCADLDRVSPHHPVFLTAKSLHAAWVNSEALGRARIGPTTPNPSGGAIVREPSGEPGGVLLEAAMSMVQSIIPGESTKALVRKLTRAQSNLWRYGITGVHDYDGPRCLDALQRMREAELLGLRVVKNIPVEFLQQAIDIGLHTGFGDATLRLGNVKVFSDGALGPRTAAMLSAYAGEPDNVGLLLLDAEELLEIALRAASAGIATSVHAIGDRANHVVLQAFESLRQQPTGAHMSRARHRIEHLQLMHPDDIPRPAALGVIASMQPIHATSDMLMADRYWGSRSRYAYAWRSLLDAGAILAFGSDAPVESPNPFVGLHAAVTRRRRDGSPGPEGWHPEQRLSLDEALRAYTSGPVFAGGLESVQGKLKAGFLADLLVLDVDPYALPSEALVDVAPVGTMVDGLWRHRTF